MISDRTIVWLNIPPTIRKDLLLREGLRDTPDGTILHHNLYFSPDPNDPNEGFSVAQVALGVSAMESGALRIEPADTDSQKLMEEFHRDEKAYSKTQVAA